MKKEIKKLPFSKIELKVSVPWAEWKKFIEITVVDLSQKMKISGFRPGKAPRNLVEQKIGTVTVLEQAAEKAIQRSYKKIIKEDKIEALGYPQVEILKLAEGNDLEYKIETAIFPKVKMKEWRDDIKEINKKFLKEKKELLEDEIEKELIKIAESRAKLVTVSREAKKGDLVFIDFKVSRDGVVIEKGTGKNHSLILGKKVFIPGFEEQLEGMKEKEEKSFELFFPVEYHEKSLSGKMAQFEVKMGLIQERQIPKLSDEFAKSLGKFENLKDLKKSVSDGLRQEKEKQKKDEQRVQILEKLVEKLEADLPDILIQEELRKIIYELENYVQRIGISLDDYFLRIGKNRKDFEKEWKLQAEKRVRSVLALEEVAKIENIEVSTEEIEMEMNKTLQYYKNQKDVEKNIDLEKLYNYTKESLISENVLKYLEKL